MLPAATVDDLARIADAEIHRMLKLGAPNMVALPRREVGFVVAVTLGAVRAVGMAWTTLLAPFGIRVWLTGVFCHGSPRVGFMGSSGTTRCELADLLIVVDAIRTERTVRRASLVQAKLADRGRRISLADRSSRHQLLLYQVWPSFTFQDTALYGAAHYDLRGSREDQSGTFGVIDPLTGATGQPPPTWTQHSADPAPRIVSDEPTLGRFLAEMVGGTRPGFGRRAAITPTDDWSTVVDLLLRVTAGQAFHHHETLGPLSLPRGVAAFMVPQPTLVQFGWNPHQPPFAGAEHIDEAARGVSILYVRAEREEN
jgi:hypothetical protein